MKMRKLLLAAAVVFAAGAAYADDIEGNWRTQAGSNARISGCGGAFCIKLTSGEHAGKQIGKMTPGGGGKYSGEITDPADDKTYTGRATLSGNVLKMKGCVFGGLICKSQTWNRL
jgi:uncharacterized protein (DUF2147 family)